MDTVSDLQHARPDRARPQAGSAGLPAAAAWQALAEASTPTDAAAAWLALQLGWLALQPGWPAVTHAVVLLRPAGGRDLVPAALHPASAGDPIRFQALVQAALKAGHDGTMLPRPDGGLQIAWPLRLAGAVEGLVAVEWAPPVAVAGTVAPQPDLAMRHLQWGTGTLAAWCAARGADAGAGAGAERERLSLVLDMVSQVLEQPSLEAGALHAASALAAYLQAERVAVGLPARREGPVRMRVLALSGSAQFERSSNLVRAIEHAMDEAAACRRLISVDVGDDSAMAAAPAHGRLARMAGPDAGACVVTVPLWGDVSGFGVAAPIAALCVERGGRGTAAARPFDANEQRLLVAVAATLGPLLRLQRDAEQPLLGHARATARQWMHSWAGPGRIGRRMAAVGVLVGLVGLATVPLPWQVGATSRIEGSLRRVVAAPFAGYVRQVEARVGDTVRAGQVLATLDDRDLQLERQRQTGALDAVQQQLREAMAQRDPTQQLVLQAQARQAQAQLALIDGQLARGSIVAPFDGVVLAGDLTQSLGSPVERGQVLFEVAPLDRWRVLLEVDERDVGQVRAGQEGAMTLAALPNDRWPFRIRQVTPINTARDGRNLYGVEAELLASGERLRPGMEGVGRIEIGRQPLLVTWVGNAWSRLRYALWGWLP